MPPTQTQYDTTTNAVLALQASVATDKTNAGAVDVANAALASALTAKSASGADVQVKLTAVIDAAVADGLNVTPTPPVDDSSTTSTTLPPAGAS
jgi:hypothetical protein